MQSLNCTNSDKNIALIRHKWDKNIQKKDILSILRFLNIGEMFKHPEENDKDNSPCQGRIKV